MSKAELEELAHFKEEMAFFPPPNRPTDRHLHMLRWITRLSEKVKCQKPILVGCGAVELFTDAQTATGDMDLITPDYSRLTSYLLQLGFQRSSDQRYCYHPSHSILFEFPSEGLRPGEQTIEIVIDGTACLVISPEDLIVDRLEAFEAAGGGTDLVYAYLIYHIYFDHLDLQRLRSLVKRIDVLESFRFIKRLHEMSTISKLSVDEQGAKLTEECRRRRGLEWPTGLS